MKTKIIYTVCLFVLCLSCKSIPEEIQELEKLSIFKISNDNNTIILDGVINSSALKEFKKLSKQYPTVNRLEIVTCEGSINDNVNLKLAKYIHENNFSIHLKNNGLVASGGTDLFLAGKEKTLGKNTRIGVHSWSDNNGIQATDFPKEHKHHKPYIEYYKSVGFTTKEAEDFYFFTINSASANDVHWMTKEEIQKFKLLK